AGARILTSGASLEVLIGPAGAGKSYTLARLAQAWKDVAGHRDAVVGLTVSQNAAEVLCAEGFDQATNLSRWFSIQERLASGKPNIEDLGFRLRRGQLLVIDEASMASAADIARVVDLARRHQAKVLVTGDHHQLAAIGEAATRPRPPRALPPPELD
ncbi:AAA family ATPase, partial [Geodermatophilus obscurus]